MHECKVFGDCAGISDEKYQMKARALYEVRLLGLYDCIRELDIFTYGRCVM